MPGGLSFKPFLCWLHCIILALALTLITLCSPWSFIFTVVICSAFLAKALTGHGHLMTGGWFRSCSAPLHPIQKGCGETGDNAVKKHQDGHVQKAWTPDKNPPGREVQHWNKLHRMGLLQPQRLSHQTT